MSSIHHISRLHYRVSCADEGYAFELRQLLSSIGTDELAGVMQAVSDQYVPETRFVRIPRLEIQLNVASPNGLLQELGVRFGAALTAALEQLPKTASVTDIAPGEEIDALFHFFQHGVLPRWASLLSERVEEIASAAIRLNPQRVLQFFKGQHADGFVWQRLRTQFSAENIDAFISIMPELEIMQERLLLAVKSTYADTVASPDLLSNGALKRVVNDLIVQNAPDILAGNKTESSLAVMLKQTVNLISAGSDLLAENADMEKPAVREDGASFEKSTPSSEGNNAGITTSGILSNEPDAESELDAKLLTRTSGLALLHPFLKPFFTELELLQEGLWKDGSSRQRGIHLLHFLAIGLQQQGEWNLILEKLMCGLPPEFPIERRIVLSELEMAECESLLNAAITHWSALKKTSSHALRETFLMRDGLLFKTDSGWQLQAERRTEDVLLEAIPWNYSMIKLPWNEYLIEVLW